MNIEDIGEDNIERFDVCFCCGKKLDGDGDCNNPECEASSSYIPPPCPQCGDKGQGSYDKFSNSCVKCGYNLTFEEEENIELTKKTKEFEKAYIENPNPLPLRKQGDLISFIENTLNDKFVNIIDPNYIHMFSVFIISASLNRVAWPDGPGRVTPNLFCINIGESGTGKSILISWLRKGMINGFKRMEYTRNPTPEGLYELGQAWLKKNKIKDGMYPLLSPIDEMTLLIKESANRNSTKVKMMETLCDSYDGSVDGADTQTDLRNGIKKIPFKIYHCLIGASTSCFLKSADETWWTGGLFNRVLWVRTMNDAFDTVTPENILKMMELLDPSFFQQINGRLTELERCTGVILPMDGEAMRIYSNWKADTLNKTRKEQDTIFTSYKTKRDMTAIKLAIIHAASRESINKISEDMYSIVVEREDMEWAINDIETLWIPQAQAVYEEWKNLTEAETGSSDIVQWIENMLLKEGTTTKDGKPEKYAYTGYGLHQNGDKVFCGGFQPDTKGEWVMQSKLYVAHHNKNFSRDKFDDMINVALELGLIEKGLDVESVVSYLRIKKEPPSLDEVLKGWITPEDEERTP